MGIDDDIQEHDEDIGTEDSERSVDSEGVDDDTDWITDSSGESDTEATDDDLEPDWR
jgi:hypothetical protein